MAQDVMRRFPDQVFTGPGGFLCIRLSPLPPGITADDLREPVDPADYAAAFERWRRVLEYWGHARAVSESGWAKKFHDENRP
jgi:hypothetical protein